MGGFVHGFLGGAKRGKPDIFQALETKNGRKHELCYTDRIAAYIKLGDVASTFYDASTPPDPKVWRSIDGHERARLIKNYLLTLTPPVSDPKRYAYLVLAVENLLVDGFRPAVRALERLLSGGVSRPEAISALVATVAANPVDNFNGDPSVSTQEKQLALNAALNSLNAAALRGSNDA